MQSVTEVIRLLVIGFSVASGVVCCLAGAAAPPANSGQPSGTPTEIVIDGRSYRLAESLAVVEPLLSSSDPGSVRKGLKYASRWYGQLAGSDIITKIIPLYEKWSDANTRVEVIEALMLIGDARAIPVFRKAAVNTESDEVRATGLLALNTQGIGLKETAHFLTSTANNAMARACYEELRSLSLGKFDASREFSPELKQEQKQLLFQKWHSSGMLDDAIIAKHSAEPIDCNSVAVLLRSPQENDVITGFTHFDECRGQGDPSEIFVPIFIDLYQKWPRSGVRTEALIRLYLLNATPLSICEDASHSDKEVNKMYGLLGLARHRAPGSSRSLAKFILSTTHQEFALLCYTELNRISDGRLSRIGTFPPRPSDKLESIYKEWEDAGVLDESSAPTPSPSPHQG